MLPVFKRIFFFSQSFWLVRGVWVCREVFSVSFVFYHWNKWRFGSPADYRIPAKVIVEPLVLFQLLNSSSHASKSLSGVSYKKMLHKTLGFLIEVSREFDFTFKDFLVNRHWIVIIKWIDSCQHFISKNSEAPPINWFSMPLVSKNLRGEIFRRPAECKSPSLNHFCKSEVCQQKVSRRIYQEVLWLQISIYNIFRM